MEKIGEVCQSEKSVLLNVVGKNETIRLIFNTAASNGELSTDSSGIKNGAGSDSLDVHSYAKLSIPIDGDGVKIDSGAEADDVMDDALGIVHCYRIFPLIVLHQAFILEILYL